jgi:hypothetical protein
MVVSEKKGSRFIDFKAVGEYRAQFDMSFDADVFEKDDYSENPHGAWHFERSSSFVYFASILVLKRLDLISKGTSTPSFKISKTLDSRPQEPWKIVRCFIPLAADDWVLLARSDKFLWSFRKSEFEESPALLAERSGQREKDQDLYLTIRDNLEPRSDVLYSVMIPTDGAGSSSLRKESLSIDSRSLLSIATAALSSMAADPRDPIKNCGLFSFVVVVESGIKRVSWHSKDSLQQAFSWTEESSSSSSQVVYLSEGYFDSEAGYFLAFISNDSSLSVRPIKAAADTCAARQSDRCIACEAGFSLSPATGSCVDPALCKEDSKFLANPFLIEHKWFSYLLRTNGYSHFSEYVLYSIKALGFYFDPPLGGFNLLQTLHVIDRLYFMRFKTGVDLDQFLGSVSNAKFFAKNMNCNVFPNKLAAAAMKRTTEFVKVVVFALLSVGLFLISVSLWFVTHTSHHRILQAIMSILLVPAAGFYSEQFADALQEDEPDNLQVISLVAVGLFLFVVVHAILAMRSTQVTADPQTEQAALHRSINSIMKKYCFVAPGTNRRLVDLSAKAYWISSWLRAPLYLTVIYRVRTRLEMFFSLSSLCIFEASRLVLSVMLVIDKYYSQQSCLWSWRSCIFEVADKMSSLHFALVLSEAFEYQEPAGLSQDRQVWLFSAILVHVGVNYLNILTYLLQAFTSRCFVKP